MSPKSHVGIAQFEKNLEKRNHPRFLLNLPIEYYAIDSPAAARGHTLNASQGGLMVCLHETLQKGQYIHLKVYFSSGGELLVVETKSEVIWIDPNRGVDGNYRYGVKFVEISSENLNKLKSFLEGLSPDLMT
jgi:hypothetical protein